MKKLLFVVVLLIAGCTNAPVRQEPFQRYLEAVQQVGQSADQAIHYEYKQELARFERTAKSGKRGLIKDLMLEFDEFDAFSASYAEQTGAPRRVFLAVGRQRSRLQGISRLATQYATLLVRIAGAEAGQFDVAQQAAQLNGRAEGLLGGDKSARLSAVFVRAADRYIENKRRARLAAVLGEGQRVMDAYARLGRAAAQSAAATLKKSCSNEFIDFVRKTPGDIAGALALNQRLMAQLEVLRRLDEAFAALAGDHARLKAAVASGDVASFDALMDQGHALKALHQELQKYEVGAN